jgi:drug/metabolite transporter (DMT)-like permease
VTSATNRRAWIAWGAVCLIWGTTYFAIKIALETIPPFLMGGLRYLAGGGILAAILYARGRSLPSRDLWGTMAVLGFFMLLLGNGGVVVAEQYVPSGLTAVLIGTSPFWMVTVNALFEPGRQLHLRQWIGLSTGFAGIVLLVWPDITAGGTGGNGFVLGVVALQIACAGWAVGSAYTRRHVVPRDVLGAAALQMMAGGAYMLVTGTVLGEWSHLAFSHRTTIAFVYLTLFGSVVAFAAYSYALRHLETPHRHEYFAAEAAAPSACIGPLAIELELAGRLGGTEAGAGRRQRACQIRTKKKSAIIEIEIASLAATPNSSPSQAPSPARPACSRPRRARSSPITAPRKGPSRIPGSPKKSPTSAPSIAPTIACRLAPKRRAPSEPASQSSDQASSESTPRVTSVPAPTY